MNHGWPARAGSLGTADPERARPRHRATSEVVDAWGAGELAAGACMRAISSTSLMDCTWPWFFVEDPNFVLVYSCILEPQAARYIILHHSVWHCTCTRFYGPQTPPDSEHQYCNVAEEFVSARLESSSTSHSLLNRCEFSISRGLMSTVSPELVLRYV